MAASPARVADHLRSGDALEVHAETTTGGRGHARRLDALSHPVETSLGGMATEVTGQDRRRGATSTTHTRALRGLAKGHCRLGSVQFRLLGVVVSGRLYAPTATKSRARGLTGVDSDGTNMQLVANLKQSPTSILPCTRHSRFPTSLSVTKTRTQRCLSGGYLAGSPVSLARPPDIRL